MHDLSNLLAVQKLSHHLSTKDGEKTTLTRLYVANLSGSKTLFNVMNASVLEQE